MKAEFDKRIAQFLSDPMCLSKAIGKYRLAVLDPVFEAIWACCNTALAVPGSRNLIQEQKIEQQKSLLNKSLTKAKNSAKTLLSNKVSALRKRCVQRS